MMSSYVSEPLTAGKVIMKTTLGDLDIELWSKEAPQTCKNFVQHCLDGYYNDVIFHKIVKDFYIQGGDPTGTGTGGESVFNDGAPFSAEIHQRLRFSRRGIVGMAGGMDDNRSQFFITLGPCDEFQDNHTVFAKVTGDTVFNLLKANEYEVVDDRPTYPPKILSVDVVWNPFEGMGPRKDVIEKRKRAKEEEEKKKKEEEMLLKKGKIKGKRDMKVLSFANELSDEEDDISIPKSIKPRTNFNSQSQNDNKNASQKDINFKIEVEEMQRKKREEKIWKQSQRKNIRKSSNLLEDDDGDKANNEEENKEMTLTQELEEKVNDKEVSDVSSTTNILKEPEKEPEKEPTEEELENENKEYAKNFQQEMIEKMRQKRRMIDPKYREWEANAEKREAERKEKERLRLIEEEEKRKKEAKIQEVFNDKRVKSRKLIIKPRFPVPPPPPSEDLEQEVYERLTKEREEIIKDIELLRMDRLEQRKADAKAHRDSNMVSRIDAFRRTLNEANAKLNKPAPKPDDNNDIPKARLIRKIIQESDDDFDEDYDDNDEDWKVHTFIAPKTEEDDGGDNYSVEDVREIKRRKKD